MSDSGLPRNPPTRFGSVIVVDPVGRLLLQERDEHARIDPERWGLCGGHLEPGEEPLPGALRELEEEAGLVPDPGLVRHVGTFEVFHQVNDALDRMDVFAVPMSITDADVVCREGRRIVFVPPSEALALPLTVGAAQVLPLFLDSPLYATMTP